jgi:hypothetical protein
MVPGAMGSVLRKHNGIHQEFKENFLRLAMVSKSCSTLTGSPPACRFVNFSFPFPGNPSDWRQYICRCPQGSEHHYSSPMTAGSTERLGGLMVLNRPRRQLDASRHK